MALALVGVCSPQGQSRPEKGSVTTAELQAFQFEGLPHKYLIQRPRGNGRYPLVMLLHGGGSDAERVWVETSLPVLGERYGFIVVAPNASLNRHWNDGRGTVGKGKPSNANDVGYLKALIEDLVRHDQADADAVFMIGISNGGIMSIRFACEAGQLLRAGGNVVSNLPVKEVARCSAGKPLPWISINGDNDRRIPFNGYAEGTLIEGHPQAALESADQTFNFFADKALCAPDTKVEELADVDIGDGSTAEKRVRSGCIGGTTSTQYVLHNAGHNVPGLAIDSKRQQAFGRANQDIDAGTVIWGHFRQTLPVRSQRPCRSPNSSI